MTTLAILAVLGILEILQHHGAIRLQDYLR
jgi:hypothetical protein